MKALTYLKRFFSLFLCAVFISVFALSEVLATDLNPEQSAVFTEVLNINIGNGAGEVGYHYGNEELHLKGPGSLHVKDNGQICILDTVNKRILKFNANGTLRNTLNLPSNAWGTQMCYYGDMFFVLDYDNDVVYAIADPHEADSLSTSPATPYFKFNLPEELPGELVCELNASVDGLFVIDIDNNHYYLEPDGAFLTGSEYFTVSGLETNEHVAQVSASTMETVWNIDRESALNSISIKDVDANNNLYVAFYEQVPDTCVMMFEKTIRRYNSSGSLTGCALIDLDSCYTHPNQEFSITSNGDVYYMECLNNSVSIKRIQLGTAYQSQMEALALEALEIESTVGEGYEFDEYGMPPEEGVKATYNISISRTMALTRARYMANYSWSLREINKRPHSQIRLPAYIRNGTVGKTVKGIPYCWGGFNGYESEGTNEAKLSFNTAKNNKRAGNTNNENGFISASAGVDCSGYVSSTYNFSNKQGTYYFRDDLGHSLNNVGNLKQMDFAVSIDTTGSVSSRVRHIVLFDRKASGGQGYYIYDSTTDSTNQNGGTEKKDRVSWHMVNNDYFNKYLCKTPWFQAGSTYSLNKTHHWKRCKFSGCSTRLSYAAHKWTYDSASSYYRCVCGARRVGGVVINTTDPDEFDDSILVFETMGTEYACYECCEDNCIHIE